MFKSHTSIHTTTLSTYTHTNTHSEIQKFQLVDELCELEIRKWLKIIHITSMCRKKMFIYQPQNVHKTISLI